MRLYKADFNEISDSDRRAWEKVKQKEVVYLNGQRTEIKRKRYTEYPKAVRHFLSLFPNNFIDAVDLMFQKNELLKTIEKFEQIIETRTTSERDILNFINKNEAFFIIGSILKNNYRFGHHALYIFPEFKIGTNFQADYLLVGENSHGHHFVFVELENPYDNITMKGGDYGQTIRKGEAQINDWDDWLGQNFAALKMEFKKSLKNGETLPDEFRDFDKTRVHFVIVAGRRSNYNHKTQRLNRKKIEESKVLVLHYDNLIETAKDTVGTLTY